MTTDTSLDLFWIPLGAGARVVRRSGRIYERLVAWRQHRPPRDLYHSALIATTTHGRYIIEMTPVIDSNGTEARGVVAEGAVGSRLFARFRVFRYEIRRWLDGVIPDLAYAVDSPVTLARDPHVVDAVIALVAHVPTLVWGRDEIGAGDMWNSNSVVAWVLELSGLIERAGTPPRQGRAPGWRAGQVAASRGTLSVSAELREPSVGGSREAVRGPKPVVGRAHPATQRLRPSGGT